MIRHAAALLGIDPGKLIPYVDRALNTIEVLTIGVVLFHVPINGDLLLLLTLTVFFLVTTLASVC